MSLLDRLNLLIRSNLNDPGAPSSKGGTLGQMKSSLRDALSQLAQLRKDERELVDHIRQARARAEQWEDRALLALRHGDEQLAKEAIVVKNQALRQAQSVRDRLEDHRRYMHDIERSLEALQMKLESTQGRTATAPQGPITTSGSSGSLRDERSWDDEFRRRLSQRGAQDPSPQGRDTPKATAPNDASETFEHFDRISDRISQMEARVAATEELSMEDIVDPRKKELDSIFKKMEQKKKTDDDLSDLKKKFS